MNLPILIRGYQGMGDTIYQRPAVRSLCEFANRNSRNVYLETSWPQLCWDFASDYGLRFCLPLDANLRTHRKNVASLPPSMWHDMPAAADMASMYGPADGSIVSTFERHACRMVDSWAPFDFSLPIHPEWFGELGGLGLDRPFALVRPATVRREWRNPHRNPHPAALQSAVDAARHRGLSIVGVADLDDRLEYEQEPRLSGIDHELYRGQLSVTAIAALMTRAECCIGGVGFLLPMGLAVRAKTFIVFGGGIDNRFEFVIDSRMDLSRLGYVMPEPMCMCPRPAPRDHDCKKWVDPQLVADTFNTWMDRQ